MPDNNALNIEGILGRLPMFRRASATQLHRLARRAELRRAAKDTMLFRRGDRAAGCYVLARGQVKLSLRAPGGAEKVLRLVGPGETFSESVVFDDQPQPVDALVLAESQLVFLPARALCDMLEHDRAFSRAMLGTLSRRIHMLIADIEAYSLSSGTQRLAAFLHSLADPVEPAPARVRLPASKTVIASRLGITKETFSRLLHEFTAQGLVEVSRREILLRDPPRLAEIARTGMHR